MYIPLNIIQQNQAVMVEINRRIVRMKSNGRNKIFEKYPVSVMNSVSFNLRNEEWFSSFDGSVFVLHRATLLLEGLAIKNTIISKITNLNEKQEL